MDEMKKSIENSIRTYKMVEKSMHNNSGLAVQNITAHKDRSFYITVGNDAHTVLPIEINLPPISEVKEHPVSEFIDNFASGEIENLKNETVYICNSSHKDCIGKDMQFETYGLYKSYPSTLEKNKSWFQRLFY